MGSKEGSSDCGPLIPRDIAKDCGVGNRCHYDAHGPAQASCTIMVKQDNILAEAVEDWGTSEQCHCSQTLSYKDREGTLLSCQEFDL